MMRWNEEDKFPAKLPQWKKPEGGYSSAHQVQQPATVNEAKKNRSRAL